jgi:hypothetical protein
MPNANAIGEKLKDLGLRHGEKAGVALASMVFFVCVGAAANKPTIDTTPENIKKSAQASDSNLNRPEKRESILEKLAEKGIKDTEFAKAIDEQVKTALVADNYKAAREWVTPEPGAGLIRDTPVLIAVSELYAYPGRGGLLVYELDKDGNRIPDLDDGKDTQKTSSRRRRRRSAAGMMGAGMGAPRTKRKSGADSAREAEEERKRQERRMKGSLVGNDTPDESASKDEKTPAEEGRNYKEAVKGFRWVALTGVLDHGQLVANYREALKNAAVAHPNYRRLDLQRQTLQGDGTWSKWETVSQEENFKVLDNLPEMDDELTPPSVRPENLVDPLPALKAGLWERVHIASFVPKEKKEVPKPDQSAGGMMGMAGMPGMGGSMRGDRGAMGAMMGGMNNDTMTKSMGSSMGRAMMGNRMGGMGMGTTESVGDFWRSDEKKVMIRAFDFTVQEDTTYRYRVRIVVFNPNRGREDVNFGVDTKAEELRGPWSTETDLVTMPPDVMPYATGSLPPTPASDLKVHFQVIRFNPADGVTVPHPFDVGPGEIVGDLRTAEVPVSDGSGKKAKKVDFDSRQIVLDVVANKKTQGYQHLPQGFVGPPVARPILALLLRPDGSVVLHSEVDDEYNDVRKDIQNNYKYELSQSSKERTNAGTVGMGSMMGRMGGMGQGGQSKGGGGGSTIGQ